MELPHGDLSRRELMRYLGVAGASTFLANGVADWAASPAAAQLVARAAKTKAHGSDLGAVDHIIFLMMENRSYDHYFGAYPRGRGFDDHPKHSLGVFAQDYPGGSALVPKNKLLPFHLDSKAGLECTDDLTHDWGPMHLCWNHGKMDSWVKVHTESQYEGPHGAMTMGYYERADLPFHWALADQFTLCDAYHCSILGPTNPNRLMAWSGTIDPSGKHGGPVTHTNSTAESMWNCTWTTMHELLEDAGVSWKVYSPSNVGVSGKYAGLANYTTWHPYIYNPTTNTEMMGTTDNVLPYFTAFRNPSSKLFNKAFEQYFPNTFVSDVKSGKLPSVSWIIPPLGFDEHPSASPMNGQYFTSLVLDALLQNEKLWSKTALFLMYDENDGWFDHVPPPTAPAGTAGEYLTNKTFPLGEPDPDVLNFKGPLGLGVRVPCLVISPFSRGGNIATEVFDHTSQLQLVSKRFGVDVPNVSKWRQKTVGDLTSALFAGKKDTKAPKLPKTSVLLPTTGYCEAPSQETDSGGAPPPSFATKQRMPNQQGGSEPASKYYKLTREEAAVPDDARTEVETEEPRPMTTKSQYNRLATMSK
ncbi:MAG TPA: alkaline phosphatase family protein [Solirubrobacteraceae bacterium]|nr:alkaline phosphatase family protein [Solirubrobacteraceae bacterium]